MKSAIAFALLDRAHDSFASAPIEEAFNWESFAEATDIKSCYMVAFRSTRKPDADVAQLDELDNYAHDDAATQPGFLFYFKGKILPGAKHLKNLSFCLWQSREAARAASARAAHRNASVVALQMYQEYVLERYEVRVRHDQRRAWVEFEAVLD